MTTIVDVAKHAGVSFKTVARALNGEANVRPATREKVMRAVDELGYVPNIAARGMRSKTPTVVALVHDNPSESWAAQVQLGAMEGCQSEGFSLIYSSAHDPASLKALSKTPGLMGILVGAPQSDSNAIALRLSDLDVPFIRVATPLSIGASPHLSVDDRAGARDIVRHLISLGHRDIAHLQGPEGNPAAELRRKGYEDALAEADLSVPESGIERGAFTVASALPGARALLTRSPRPTAIFAANDDMAAACLAEAYRLQLRVPDDVSIAGFDDAPIARAVFPGLTTVRQSTRDMAKLAVEQLAALRRGETLGDPLTTVPHTIVVRESCGLAPD